MYFPHIVFHGADEDNFLNKTFTKVYLLIFSFFPSEPSYLIGQCYSNYKEK